MATLEKVLFRMLGIMAAVLLAWNFAKAIGEMTVAGRKFVRLKQLRAQANNAQPLR